MMIEIDGAEGEGGGQIFRCALGLATLTGKEIRVVNIRSNRPNPGLAGQHLTAVKGVAQLSDARVEGASIGSRELTFLPGKIKGGRYRLDIGTAGSVTLVLQACLLAACRSDSEITLELTGGTNVRWSPPVDFYEFVLLPLLDRMGMKVRMEVLLRGFYPEGGGRVVATISPVKQLRQLDLEKRGDLIGVEGASFVQNLTKEVAQRMAIQVRKRIITTVPKVRVDVRQGRSAGAGVFLCAKYANTVLSGDSLGEKGIPSEKVADMAVDALQKEMWSEASLDVHAADQLPPYMVLAGGPSRFRVRKMTGHMQSQIDLILKFFDAWIEAEGKEGSIMIQVKPNRT